MGKVVSVYLDKKEYEKVKKLMSTGVLKKDAVARVLADRERGLHEDHELIIKLLEEIRAAPILQIGAKAPVVTVEVPETKKLSWLRRIFRRGRET